MKNEDSCMNTVNVITIYKNKNVNKGSTDWNCTSTLYNLYNIVDESRCLKTCLT